MESGEIVKQLAEQHPDPETSKEEQAEVLKWIDYNNKTADRLLEALKHWGWQAMHGDKKNYAAYGRGKKDMEWERALVDEVNTFFAGVDKHFAGKENKTFFVGDKLTYADCAMLNWAWSFQLVLKLDVPTRYPDCWANAVAMKKLMPDGSNDFYKKFPMFAMVVGVCNARNRGTGCFSCGCGRGFYIENPMYWGETSASI